MYQKTEAIYTPPNYSPEAIKIKLRLAEKGIARKIEDIEKAQVVNSDTMNLEFRV